MSTKEIIIKDGKVTESLMGGMFKIELDGDEEVKEILAALSGKMRKFKIKILPGDKVKVEISPYDLTKGRIIYRFY